MKVCIVSFQAYPLLDPTVRTSVGGAEVQLVILARYLVRKGWQVDLVVRDHGQSAITHHEGIRSIKSVALDHESGFTDRVAGLWRVVRALARSNADVYVMSTASAHVGVGWLVSRARSRRFVFRTAHEHDCNGEYERQNGWQGWLYERGLRGADVVVTQNEDHQRILADRGIASCVIHNAFVLPQLNETHHRQLDCLWVARCEPWKNPQLFLDLAEGMPERRFLMICPPAHGQRELFSAIRDRAATIRNVEFTDWVDYADIQDKFEQAKVFVGTSDFEGFPNTYIQACMAGTPIATLKVNPDRFVTDNALGIDAEGSFADLQAGVTELLQNETAWAVRSTNALAYVRTHHDIEREGRKWMAVLSGDSGSVVPPAEQ